MKRKLLFCFFAVVAIIAGVLSHMFAVPVRAEGATVSSVDASAHRGETVVVAVTISTAVSAKSGAISVAYDGEMLKLEGGTWNVPNAILAYFDADTELGAFLLADEVALNGTVFTASFSVADDAAFRASDVRLTLRFKDKDSNDLEPIEVQGRITVVCAHEYGEWVAESATQHKHTCAVCGDEVAEDHASDTWIVTKEATCVATGSRHKVCTDCGEKFAEEVIPARGHDWKAVEGQAATCVEAGWTDYEQCAVCKEIRNRKELSATGHTSSEWIVTKAATCEEAGSQHKICTVCNVELAVEEIKALGHKYGDWMTVTKATCTEQGLEERICAHDDSHKETRKTDALGHDFVHHDAKAATCTENGWNAYDTCKRCDYTTKVEISATGHTSSEWIVTKAATCEEAGSQHKICTICNEELVVEEIKALGHKYGDWTTVTKATCTEQGLEERICEHDDSHKETRKTEALGHDVVHHDAKAATCTENGWNAYDTCKRCDYTTYEEIPAHGHTEGEWIVDKEPTTNAEGARHKECTECGETIRTEVLPKLPPEESDEPQRKGCFGSIGTRETLTVVGIIAAAAVLMLLKRKFKE